MAAIPKGWMKLASKPTCVAVDTGAGTAYQVTYHFTYGKPTEAGLMILDLPPYRFDLKKAERLGNRCVVKPECSTLQTQLVNHPTSGG